MIDKKELSKIRKKAKASGATFERRVRGDLENKGWIVAKWSNNVELLKEGEEIIMVKENESYEEARFKQGKLVPAKHKFRGIGIPMVIGTGFPDFIAFKYHKIYESHLATYEVIGVESKSNGYLTKQERDKCDWLLKNNIFSKILIAKKGEKRGEIVYIEYDKE